MLFSCFTLSCPINFYWYDMADPVGIVKPFPGYTVMEQRCKSSCKVMTDKSDIIKSYFRGYNYP